MANYPTPDTTPKTAQDYKTQINILEQQLNQQKHHIKRLKRKIENIKNPSVSQLEKVELFNKKVKQREQKHRELKNSIQELKLKQILEQKQQELKQLKNSDGKYLPTKVIGK